jgi:hypothetical protein
MGAKSNIPKKFQEQSSTLGYTLCRYVYVRIRTQCRNSQGKARKTPPVDGVYLVCLLGAARHWQHIGLLPRVPLGEEVSIVDERRRRTAPPEQYVVASVRRERDYGSTADEWGGAMERVRGK